MKKILCLAVPLSLVVILYLCLSKNLFAQTPQPNNTITLTTYYPAPFGAYKKMTVYDSVGIGTTNPGSKLEVDETSTGSIRGMINTQYSDDALGGLIIYRKARGTAASPLRVLNRDDLGLSIFGGYDGNFWGEGASIEAQASEDWTFAGHGTKLIFATTPNGATTPVPQVIIDQDGNVGIGTTNPIGRKLYVSSDSSSGALSGTEVRVHDTNPAGDHWAQFAAVSNNGGAPISTVLFAEGGLDTGGVGTNSNHPFYIRTNVTERMRFDTNGLVGIGTPSPMASLDVFEDVNYIHMILIRNPNAGSDAFSALTIAEYTSPSFQQFVQLSYVNSGNTNTSLMRIPSSATLRTGTSTTGGLVLFTQAPAPIIFGTGGTSFSNERMRIDATGNVGIGTTSPSEKLHIKDGSIYVDGNPAYVFFDANKTYGLKQYPGRMMLSTGTNLGADVDGSGNGDAIMFMRGFSTELMRITNHGKVGVGITDPQHPLELASGAHVTAGGVWTDASSIQYKQDVASLPLERAYTVLAGLDPVTFRYKVDPEEKHVGFIAEDVPELVAGRDRKGLSPMDIVAVLTRVVQEQQKRIGALEKRLNGL